MFQIQGLTMYQREEKLESRRRLKLGGWSYAPPENFAILRPKYEISVAEVQTFLLMKRP